MNFFSIKVLPNQVLINLVPRVPKNRTIIIHYLFCLFEALPPDVAEESGPASMASTEDSVPTIHAHNFDDSMSFSAYQGLLAGFIFKPGLLVFTQLLRVQL